MTTKPVSKDEHSSSSSSDRISALPQPIIESILCLLPTKVAARTSILSKEWRYKWNKIPKLELDYKKYLPTRKTDMRCKHFSDVLQVLLLRQGPLHELTIYICQDCQDCRYNELDQILLHLAKNQTLKKLTLHLRNVGYWKDLFEIPISVFTLNHLTELVLSSVTLEDQPIFNEFCSLRSLVLDHVWISTKSLLHILSNCPSLKSLSLIDDDIYFDDIHCTPIDLFKCLPVIEDLTICHDIFEWLVLDSVPNELPTSLCHLRYFCFQYLNFDDCDGDGLAFLLLLIKCSPNMEKIELKIEWGHECDGECQCPILWEQYLDVWLENLSELEIKHFTNSKLEMDFVKFILARSPKLKKVSIRTHRVVNWDPELKTLEVLLEAPRASQVIITVR